MEVSDKNAFFDEQVAPAVTIPYERLSFAQASTDSIVDPVRFSFHTGCGRWWLKILRSGALTDARMSRYDDRGCDAATQGLGLVVVLVAILVNP